MSLRILAGAYKGRALACPKGESIRPTAARTREAAFNLLEHHAALHDAGCAGVAGKHVLDLCCGTGAMGLEALSRGAAHVTFVDKDKASLQWLRQNIEKLGAKAEATVIQAPAEALPRRADPADIVWLDPPYHQGLAPKILQGLMAAECLRNPCVILCEEADFLTESDIPAGYRLLDTRRYGAAALTLLGYHI